MNSYQQMLAKLSADQRAEWDRCVEIYGQKFGTEPVTNDDFAAEWTEHDCRVDRCLEGMLEQVRDGRQHRCPICSVGWMHGCDPILKCEHAAVAESPEGMRHAAQWAEDELRILSD